jgi:peptidoglycan/LPS O-acetylase OafA/YrhL
MANGPKFTRHVPELDGVRGVAILIVVLYHFSQGPPRSLLTSLFGLGWSGVDLFFALSGFLITGILLETRTALNYFRVFYLRRFLRILPLYTCVLIAFFHLAVPLAHHFHLWANLETGTEKWYFGYLANWPIGHHQSISMLIPYWSLSVEEQFYAVWPAVVLLASDEVLASICGFLIAGAFALRCIYSPHPGGIFVYVWTPFRMDVLAMGALCALIVRNGRWSARLDPWLTPFKAACVFTMLVFVAIAHTTEGDGALLQRWGFSVLGLLYGGVVLRCAIRSQSGDWLCRLMAARPLRRLGTVSYGMYLLHYFVLTALAAAMSRLTGRVAIPPLVCSLLMIAAGGLLSYGAAECSWRLLEQRVLALKSRWPYRYPSLAVSPQASPEPLNNPRAAGA